MDGAEARLVLLEGEKSSFFYKDVDPKNIPLTDDENQEEVKAFSVSLFAFFRENKVDQVAIKKRSKSGKYCGGPVGFKLEAIAQLYNDCPVVLIAPQTVAKIQKKFTPKVPVELYKYQSEAFNTAYSALP